MILNDRSNAGASLADGQIQLLLHRRLTNPALKGEALNEMEDGQGIIIGGSHSLILTQKDGLIEEGRQRQSRLFSPFFVAYHLLDKGQSISDYSSSHVTQSSFLVHDLPINVELLSLQWTLDGTLLLRLAHQFSVNEHPLLSLPVTVDLQSLFTQSISSVSEWSLTANTQKSKERKRTQNQQMKKQSMRTKRLGFGLQPDGFNVTIGPMEIRTFIIQIKQ